MVMRSVAARGLTALAILTSVWAAIALVIGGARFQLGTLTISSRNPVRPATVALLLLVVAWRLDRQTLEPVVSRAERWFSGSTGRWVPVVAAVTILGIGVVYGGRAAIAADQSGYVSQSHLWGRGDLHIDMPLADEMPWPDAIDTFTPIGYRSADARTLVPFYPAGFPMLMAAVRPISPCAPVLIVPLCAAMLTLLTWRIGARLFGRGVGIVGSVTTAASPVVITWTLSPMSDVPAAVFWLGALLAADRQTIASSFVAGALSGGAILIRPNLVPLAIFPVVLAVLSSSRRDALARWMAIAAGVLPFALFLLWLHATLYGSQWSSGYGDFWSNFSWRHVAANATRYPVWWWTAHGILGWLFLLNAPWRLPSEVRRRVWTLIGFVAAVALSYIFYLPFDDWTYLRFTMPALPIVLLLSANGASRVLSLFGRKIRRCGLAALAVLAVAQGVHVTRSSGAFRQADVNQRFVDAARYIDVTTSPSSVILSSLHSGSVAYYSGRLVLRYDLLDREWLDRALDHLRQRGFEPYALLEQSEERAFLERFPTAHSTSVLDGTPAAVRRESGGELRLYQWNSSDLVPAEIPRLSRFDCIAPSPRFAAPVESAIR